MSRIGVELFYPSLNLFREGTHPCPSQEGNKKSLAEKDNPFLGGAGVGKKGGAGDFILYILYIYFETDVNFIGWKPTPNPPVF